jgi:exopolysaccharide biosynthesis polyprenyl glycosylphosphotransferase
MLYKLQIIPFLKKWHLINIIVGVIDIIAIAIAFQFSYMISYFTDGVLFLMNDTLSILFICITPTWLLTLYLINVANIPRTKRYRILLLEYFQSALVITLVLIVIYYGFRLTYIPRRVFITIPLAGFLLLLSARMVEYILLKNFRSRGHNQENLVLICDDTATGFLEKLFSLKEWGYNIKALITDSEPLRLKYEKNTIMLPLKFGEVLNDLMEVDLVDEVLYYKDKINVKEVRLILSSCEELGITFRLKYKEPESNISNAIKTTFANEKFLTFINIPHNSIALTAKRIMDVTISLLGLIVLSPLFMILSIVIKISSKGPLFFRQTRVGLRGRLFRLYKFRTMILNAEELRKKLEYLNEVDGPVFKIKDDPRVTRAGRILRSFGLDELPQLLNVLKGEMSLIGPRPPLQRETNQYKRWQLRRLSVRPGLSCFWQIKPERNNIKFEKWMEMDLAYIDNWSLRLDFIILIRTIRNIFQRTSI